jgi:hypothetical protein
MTDHVARPTETTAEWKTRQRKRDQALLARSNRPLSIWADESSDRPTKEKEIHDDDRR